MFATARAQGPQHVDTPLVVKPLHDPAWHAWVARGRVQDRRRSASHFKAVRWVSIAGLLAAAGLWSQLPPYEVVLRWLVAGGAMILMFQAFRAQRYAVAAVFGALALLYNPVAPAFTLSGDWHRYLVVVSAVPFLASLAWRNARLTSIN